MLNLNHLPPYYGPRMQTRMRERSQKYACRGTSLDIRTYGRALASACRLRPPTQKKVLPAATARNLKFFQILGSSDSQTIPPNCHEPEESLAGSRASPDSNFRKNFY